MSSLMSLKTDTVLFDGDDLVPDGWLGDIPDDRSAHQSNYVQNFPQKTNKR